MKKKTITIPWSVNIRLYMSDRSRSPRGVSSSSLIRVAASPPTKKNSVIEIMYKQADPLVVGRQQPRLDRVIGC